MRVFKLKENLLAAHGVVLHPLAYQLLVLVACWLALQSTFGDILRELKIESRKSGPPE